LNKLGSGGRKDALNLEIEVSEVERSKGQVSDSVTTLLQLQPFALSPHIGEI